MMKNVKSGVKLYSYGLSFAEMVLRTHTHHAHVERKLEGCQSAEVNSRYWT